MYCLYMLYKKAHGKLVGTIINTKSSTKFVFHNSCIKTIVYLHKQKQLNEKYSIHMYGKP